MTPRSRSIPGNLGDGKGGEPNGFGPDRSLLIVDDDNTFLTRLSRSMEIPGLHRNRRPFGRRRSRSDQ